MQEESKSFLVYKGLQMPLVLKGFKGRYIYWGLGLLLSSFILATGLVVTTGIIIGVLFMITYLGAGLYFLSMKQKQGMYSKNKSYSSYIPEHRIKSLGRKIETANEDTQ
tara:strand:- start:63827 stop:64153 length:327 start_codon:yes stop_codon:yes gene_type:complete